jgi:bisphosphoglycerate-independent phosphoglycerate mutase (AlkP superfamily)
MNKVILVLSDALRYDVAVNQMGFLGHLVEAKKASLYNMILSNLVMEWLERVYNILVTGDHGMSADRLHGGTTPDVREVPLFIIQPDAAGRGNTGEVISQLQIAPTVLKLMNLPIPETMKYPPVL